VDRVAYDRSRGRRVRTALLDRCVFSAGIAAAEIARRPQAAAWFERNGNALFHGGCALLVIGTVAAPHALLTLAHGPRFDVLPQIVALCAIFVGVGLGPGPGVLKRMEPRYAGAISYSVYLLHAIVLYVASYLVASVVPLGVLAPGWYCVFVVTCVPVVVALATCSYFAGGALLRASRSCASGAPLQFGV